MAQSIDIKIQIKEAGYQVIEDLRRRLRALAEDLKNSQAQIGIPIEKISESFKDFGNAIETIKDSVAGVETIVTKVIESIRNQSEDLADSTISRVGETIDQALETFYSRTAVAFAGFGTMAGLYVSSVLTPLLQGFPILLSGAQKIGGAIEVFLKQLFSLDGLSALIQPRVEAIYNIFNGINTSAGNIFAVLSNMSSIVQSIFGAAVGFFAFKIFFTETTVLVRRLLGMGIESLTPIERATRLLSTVDQSVHAIGINAGTLLKTATFGILTFMGPFSGIIAGIPFINSTITSLLQIGQRFRYQFMSFFGSSRAQVGLIVFDLKTLLVKVLPDLLKVSGQIAPAITSMTKVSGILKQGTDAVGNLQKMIALVLAEITKVGNLLQKIFAAAKSEVVNLGNKAKDEVSNVQKKLDTSSSSKRRGSMISFDRFQGMPKTNVDQANVALEKQAQVLRVATQEIDKYKAKIAELLNLQGMFSKKQGGAELRTYFKNLITSAFGASLSREFSQEHLNKSIATFMAKAFAYAGPIAGSRDLAQKVSKTINEAIAEAAKLGVATTPVLGKSVMRILAASLDPNASPELKAAANKVITGITGFLKQSISKAKESGKEIDNQIAQGIENGIGATNKATKKMVTGVKEYLPGSLAKLMPLRGLIQSGMQIPIQLAQGMLQGVSSVFGAAKRIASAISTEIERNIKLYNLSASVGVSVEKLSAFQGALTALGAGSEDLTFVFAKLNESIRKSLKPEELEEFKKLGVNLDKVRASADPTLSLFLELSDVLKNSAPGSDSYRKALELLGTTASSGLVPALKVGKEALKRLALESVESGFVVSAEFAKISKDTKAMFDSFEKIRNSLVDTFLSGLLPALNQVGKDILDFYREHSLKIQGFVGIVANILGETIKLTSKVIQDIFKNPGLALEIARKMLLSVFSFIMSTFDNFWNNLSAKILAQLQAIGSMLLTVPITFTKQLFTELLALAKNQVDKLVLEVMHTFTKQFADTQDMGNQIRRTILKKLGLGEIIDFADDLNAKYDGMLTHFERKTFDTAGIVGATIKSAKDEYEKVIASTKNIALISPEVFEKMKSDLKELSTALADAISGTPFEATFDEFEKRVQELLNKYLTTLKEQREKIKKEIDGIQKPQASAGPPKQPKGWWDSWGKGAEDTVGKTANSLGQMKDLFSNFYDFSGKKRKEFLIAQKAMAIGEIILSAAAATMKAIATAPHVAFGIAQAAIIAALAGTQIAKVAMQNFVKGGRVDGPGGIDNVPARLTRGEYVMPTWSVAKYGVEAMEGLRQNLFPTEIFDNFSQNFRPPVYVPRFAYASGGPVIPPPPVMQTPAQDPKQLVNIVNLIDPNLFEAYLASSSGERMVMNVLNKNRNEARQIMT